MLAENADLDKLLDSSRDQHMIALLTQLGLINENGVNFGCYYINMNDDLLRKSLGNSYKFKLNERSFYYLHL